MKRLGGSLSKSQLVPELLSVFDFCRPDFLHGVWLLSPGQGGPLKWCNFCATPSVYDRDGYRTVLPQYSSAMICVGTIAHR